MKDKEVVYLCRRECCPSMLYNRDEDILEITDDFGGKVSLSPKDFQLLVDSFSKHFSKDSYNA